MINEAIAFLPEFLLNRMSNDLAVIAGCLIGTMYLQRKSYYWLRVAASSILILLWMFWGQLVGNHFHLGMEITGTCCFGGLFFFSAAAVCFYCKATRWQALFAVTVSYSIQNICENMIRIPWKRIEGFPRPLIILLFAASLYLYFRWCQKYRKKQTLLEFITVDDRTTLLLAAVVALVSVVLDLMIKSETIRLQVSDKLSISINLLMMLFSGLAILVCMSHLRETDAQKRAEEAAMLLRNEQRRFEHDKQIHEAINIKCHDIRHQIAAIRSQSTDDTYRSELKKIGQLVDIYDTTPHSQNAALDVVLSGKMLACHGKGITITCMADGRRLGFMEDCDIYALFGNILDNAIEAASKVTNPEQRMISLTVGTKGNFLTIEAENFFSGPLSFEDGLPITTKEDKLNHGFGTQSIRILVDKYDGYMKFSAEEDIFTLSILLPLPPEY